MSTPAAAGDRAVTIVATRRVRRGHEAAYEAALEALLRDATVFAGYRGTEVQRPTPGAATPTYTSVFRFDSVAHLQAFDRTLPDLETWCRRRAPAAVQCPAPSETSAAMRAWSCCIIAIETTAEAPRSARIHGKSTSSSFPISSSNSSRNVSKQ